MRKARKKVTRLRRRSSDGGVDSMSNAGEQLTVTCTTEQHMEEECCTSQHATHNINAAFASYAECYKEGWEFTFVGCCHDQYDFCNECKHLTRPCKTDCCPSKDDALCGAESNEDDMSAFTTQFNVTALVPSVQRLYVDLWDTIELSLLGYYDAEEAETVAHHMHHPGHHSQFPVPAIMRILRTSVLPELAEYLFFVVGFKPLAVRGIAPGARARRRRDGGVLGPMFSRGLGGVDSSQQRQHLGASSPVDYGNNNGAFNDAKSFGTKGTQETDNTKQQHLYGMSKTTLEEINSLRDAATTMSAYKLACILRERGIGCLRCALCDRIDLLGDLEDECDGMNYVRHFSEDDDDEDSVDNGHSASTRISSNNDNVEAGGRSPFLREFQKQIGGGEAWMTPCQCPELVHRQCLEQKLKLIPKYEPWERAKLQFGSLFTLLCSSISGEIVNVEGDRHSPGPTDSRLVSSSPTDEDSATAEPIAPRVWISYDNTIPVRRPHHQEDNVIAVDNLGRFISSAAKCETCGWQFHRTVRLPRSKWEGKFAEL